MMRFDAESAAEQLALYCRKVYDRGLSPATTGNVSLMTADRVYITPTGCCLGEVYAEDVVAMSLQGEKLAGSLEASSEWLIHRELYLTRSDIQAVIHAHPPKATSLAACHITIDKPLIAEMIINLGDVPLVPYTMPGSQALAGEIARYLGEARVMLLANHGVIAIGSDIRQAFFNLELLESLAEIYILAHSMPGGPRPLDADEVASLMAEKVSPGLGMS
jgi:L-fuculose-phosphate aldolase